jgi:hypothetical protein
MSLIYPAELSLRYSELADELEDDDPFRSHLGASGLGSECARQVWYDWRWFSFEQHSGRKKRLFKRGHREEPIVLESLAKAGITSLPLDPATGKQWVYSGYKGHEGGSCDGFLWNVPDVPANLWTLFECKTHNDKNFKLVRKENELGYNTGIIDKFPKHYAQCQLYMNAWSLQWTLYVAVNKNDDERYQAIIPYNEEHALQLKSRAIRLVDATVPPPRISDKATSFKCTFCKHKEVCHTGAAPLVNCRTCVYSRAIDGGEWQCANPQHEVLLYKELQRTGCGNYKAHS